MKQAEYSNQFKKDLKICKKRNYKIDLLKQVIANLIDEKPLKPSNKEHLLIGNYVGYKECHISSDWLLIYKYQENAILFARTGTHSDLF